MLFKRTRTFLAVESNDVEEVKKLLRKKIDPNMRLDTDYRSVYLLECAANKGNPEIVALLLEYGAKVDIRHGSPFHEAAKCGHVDVVEVMLESDPDLISSLDGEGNTALHIAAAHGHAKVAAYLLSMGADPNSENFNHRTPLFLAQKQNNKETEALLMPLTKTICSLSAAEEQKRWKMLSTQKVAHIMVETDIGYKITDVFNFESRDRTRIVQNLETKAETIETKSFDDIADKTPLETACEKLKQLGGQADAGSIYATLQGKQKLPVHRNNPS